MRGPGKACKECSRVRQRCNLVEHGVDKTPKRRRVGSTDPIQELGRDVKAMRIVFERALDILERIAGRNGEEPEGNMKRKRVVESEADSGERTEDEEKTEEESEGEAEKEADENGGVDEDEDEVMDVDTSNVGSPSL